MRLLQGSACFWLGAAIASLQSAAASSQVTDADGNVYATVQIGSQVWLAENLKTTKFNDATPIPENVDPGEWGSAVAQYQWADTRDLNDIYEFDLPHDFYGAVYNEAAIASGLLPPVGCRLPTEQDWIELRDFIAGDGFAGQEGAALRTKEGWPFASPGLDAYGFGGLPAGYVSAVGTATGAGVIATWASTDLSAGGQHRIVLDVLDALMEFHENSILLGATIRCLVDETATSAPEAGLRTGLRLGAPSPAPSQGDVRMSLTFPEGTDTARLDVFDIRGRRVREKQLRGEPGESAEIEFRLSDLSAGVYFVRVEAAGQRAVRKLVLIGSPR